MSKFTNTSSNTSSTCTHGVGESSATPALPCQHYETCASASGGLEACRLFVQRQRDGLPGLGTAGHRLGEFHISDTIFKAGQRDLFLAPNGVHELFFNTPRALLVRRHRDVLQLFVAPSSTLQGLGRVVQRALTAKQP